MSKQKKGCGNIVVDDPKTCSKEELLRQHDVFPASKVCPILTIKTSDIKSIYNEEVAKGNNPKETVGLSLQEDTNRLLIHMPTFGPIFKRKFKTLFGREMLVRSIPLGSDGQKIEKDEFLRVEGMYKMSGLIHLLPMSRKELYAILKTLRSQGGMKILNDDGIYLSATGRYMIKMPKFTDFFLALTKE